MSVSLRKGVSVNLRTTLSGKHLAYKAGVVGPERFVAQLSSAALGDHPGVNGVACSG